MSVLIKGMEMPKRGHTITITIEASLILSGWCPNCGAKMDAEVDE